MKSKYELWLIEELHKIENFQYEDIQNLHQYPLVTSKQVLRVLIENACLGQNYAPIELGRKKINEINKEWLGQYFLEVAETCIDFSDEWEYRRLVELVDFSVTELKDKVFELGVDSDNEEIRELVEEFQNLGEGFENEKLTR